MTTGMISLTTKRCEHNGCNGCPSYGFPSVKKRQCCADHAKEGMIDVQNQKCVDEGCVATANYGVGRARTHCGKHKKKGMDIPKTLAKRTRTRGTVVATPCSSAAGIKRAHTASSAVETARAAYTVVTAATTSEATFPLSTSRASGGNSTQSTTAFERESVSIDSRQEGEDGAREKLNTKTTAVGSLGQPVVEESTAAKPTAAEEVLSAQALAAEEPTAAPSEDVVQRQELEVGRDPTAAVAKVVQMVVASVRTSPASAAVPASVGSASSSCGGHGGGGDGGSGGSRWLGGGATKEGGGWVDNKATNLYLLADTCRRVEAAASGEGCGGVSGSGSVSGVGDEHEVCIGDSKAHCV